MSMFVYIVRNGEIMDIDAIHSVVLTLDEQAAVFALSERVDLAWAILMARYGCIVSGRGENILVAGENKLLSRGILAKNAIGMSHMVAPFDQDTRAISACTVAGFLSCFDDKRFHFEEILFGTGRFAAIYSERGRRSRFSFGVTASLLGYVLRTASAGVSSDHVVADCARSIAEFIGAIANEANLSIYHGGRWSFNAQWSPETLAHCADAPNGYPVIVLALKNSKVVDADEGECLLPDGLVEFVAFPDRCEVIISEGTQSEMVAPNFLNLNEKLNVEIL